MAPPVAKAELSLSYPIWATDFDPNNSDFLLVGGGGGESKTGVGNKITLIDASRKTTIAEVADVDLSRDEDSVTSLGVSHSDEKNATVLAGINSSAKDQAKGKNEHLRSFKLGLPAKRKREEQETTESAEKVSGEISQPKALGKASFFRTPPGDKNETYQRVLRLSRAERDNNARMGVIATGLAPAGEVVIFNATTPAPGENDILKRIRLDNKQEAADVDVLCTDPEAGEYLVAYCTTYEISVCPVSLSGKAKSTDPRLLFQYPIPDVFKDIQRPTFRSLRLLTPTLLAAVIHLPKRSGAELVLVDIPKERALEGSIILRKRFHKALKTTTAFAVTTLPGTTPTQNIQHVLAIAGQDSSVTVLTLDQSPTSNHKLTLPNHTVLKEVHKMQLTSLSLSTFHPPTDPTKATPQYLKLASTGIDSSVVVHTFPLTPHPHIPKPNSSEKQRYTLRAPGVRPQTVQNLIGLVSSIIAIGLAALFMQAFLEIRGGAPEWLGAKDYLPATLRDLVAREYDFHDDVISPRDVPHGTGHVAGGPGAQGEAEHFLGQMGDELERLGDSARAAMESAGSGIDVGTASVAGKIVDIKSEIHAAASAAGTEGPKQAVLITSDGDVDEGLSAAVHHEEHLEGAEEHRRWEQLGEEERGFWRERLRAAGRWVEGEAETVLKGVFFGELAGAVGGVVREL